MSLAKSCGSCGASNKADAAFCLQCMEAFAPLTLPKPPHRFLPDAQKAKAEPFGHTPSLRATAGQPVAQTSLSSDRQPHEDRAHTNGEHDLSQVDVNALDLGQDHLSTQTNTHVFTEALHALGLGDHNDQSKDSPSNEPANTPVPNHIEVVLNDQGVGVVNGRPVWQCQVCDQLQSMESFSCTQCGTRFGAKSADPVYTAGIVQKEWYYPGFGFYLAGDYIQALTRVLVATSWIATALFVGIKRPIVALPLLVGVGVLWFYSPRDLEQTLLGQEPFLNGKRMLTLITATLLAFILGGAAYFILATRSGL